MRILSPVLVNAFPKRIINIHPADTTAHQGLHGYEWAWENKLPETKITVHFVDEGLDTGSIIAQEIVDLRGVTSLEEVEARGLAIEHKLYSKTLSELLQQS
jgi:phosphoribosylglycinamide formyltransferase-1